MSKGFIFNHEKCVGCGSCSASCILENGWSVRPRDIYNNTVDVKLPAAVINLSLACNHCADPLCLKGCPANAYHKDQETGAIIIDDDKCLGCRYCQWNCPFDAPKFDSEKRVIGKCNLCYASLHEGIGPACSRACPTGALGYGEISDPDKSQWPDWFPASGIKPSIELTGSANRVRLMIIPESKFLSPEAKPKQVDSINEWSLVIFSFLVTVAASVMCSSLIKGEFPPALFVIAILAASGIASLFHPGKPMRAWRSVVNARYSALSREIILFLLFSIISVSAMLTRLPSLLVAASVAGVITLAGIDNVYMLGTVNIRRVLLHSGQTLLTGLLIISYLSHDIIPFIFIAMIKFTFAVLNPRLTRNNIIPRFIRIAFLLIVVAGWVSGFAVQDTFMLILLLSGEFIDRSLFYCDFEPVNIRQSIFNYNIISKK